jgi:hypothetical protein
MRMTVQEANMALETAVVELNVGVAAFMADDTTVFVAPFSADELDEMRRMLESGMGLALNMNIRGVGWGLLNSPNDGQTDRIAKIASDDVRGMYELLGQLEDEAREVDNAS